MLTKRALETKVVVDDGQTIVLGGLIQNLIQESVVITSYSIHYTKLYDRGW